MPCVLLTDLRLPGALTYNYKYSHRAKPSPTPPTAISRSLTVFEDQGQLALSVGKKRTRQAHVTGHWLSWRFSGEVCRRKVYKATLGACRVLIDGMDPCSPLFPPSPPLCQLPPTLASAHRQIKSNPTSHCDRIKLEIPSKCSTNYISLSWKIKNTMVIKWRGSRTFCFAEKSSKVLLLPDSGLLPPTQEELLPININSSCGRPN